MRRLRIEDSGDSEAPRLKSLPAIAEAPHELIAALVAALETVGARLSYAEALGLSGAAFMLHFGPEGPAHLDACRGRERFLCEVLAQKGFPGAQLISGLPEGLDEVRGELIAGRPPVVQGCFPEAPWRAGLITAMLPEGRWAVLDCSGRVHSLAPRAEVMVLLGEPGEPAFFDATALLRRALIAWEGDGAEEGAAGWRRWIGAVASGPHQPAERLAEMVAAHEFLYEALVDARGAAVVWLEQQATEVEDVVAAWLTRVTARLEEMVELLDTRHPPAGDPLALRAFADAGWRQNLAERLAEAAELDLAARHDLARALQADYPPEEEEQM